MSHKTLYMLREDKDGPEILGMSKKYWDFWREANEDDCTAEAVAEMLDHDAENGNYHDFVGCHASLVSLLSEGLSVAEVMRRLADYGGLHWLRD